MINPTGYTALDLVGFTDRGTYASNVNYVKNDIVHYGGNLWRCKIDDTMNVTPAEGNNWTVFVGEPTNLVERIIAPLEENPATVAYAAGRQIIYDDWLWEVIDDIAVGDPLVDYDVDPLTANIKKADPVETQLLAIKAKEGNLTNLTTTAKTDLVSAINEVDGDVGNLSSLTTTAKTSAVAAINELDDKVSKTEVLYIKNIACSATTGNFATKSDARITANHVVTECVFSKPSAITSVVNWTTASGSLALNGTCTDATCTVSVILALSNNN